MGRPVSAGQVPEGGAAPLVGEAPRAESSSSLARRLVRELLERLGPGPAHPSLRLLDGPATGVVLPLPELGRGYLLGRAAGSDLRLDDIDLWREHALLERGELGVTLRAMGAHLVVVNGVPVAGSRPLADGDLVALGATTAVFSDPAERYLRQLDGAPAHARPRRMTPPGRSRLELTLLLAGALVALLALVALVGLAFE